MGYEIDRIVSEIDEKFLCSICTMVLENPMQSPCEHTFCSDCIEEWLKVQANCPVDSSSLALDDMKPPPRHFSSLLDKFEIKCNFEPKGCQLFAPLEQLQHHLNECAFNPNAEVVCDKGCNIEITRLRDEVDRQQKLFTHSVDVMECQREEIDQQRHEITKLTDEIKRQREENTKLNNELQKSCFQQSDNGGESVPSTAMRGILALDDLCLKKILKFLKPINFCPLRQSCTQLRDFVDGHFHSLHYVREKWLDLTAENIGTVNRILQNFGKHVRHLKVREEWKGQNLLLDVIRANGGAMLKGLSLHSLQFYEMDMDKFAGVFDNLEILELIDCGGDRKCIEQFLSGHEYPNLKTLRIDSYLGTEHRMEQIISWTDFPKAFFMRKRSIMELRCWGIGCDLLPLIVLNGSQIEDLTIFPVYGRNLMPLVMLENLKRLEIKFWRCDQISIIALIKGLSVTNQLEMLGVHLPNFTNEFCDTLSNLTNLKELRLGHLRYTLNDFKSLEMLGGKLSKLESLMLVNCSDFPYRSFLASACKSDKFRTFYVHHAFSREVNKFVEETVKDFIEGRGHRCFVLGDPLCLYLHEKRFENMKEFLTQENLQSIEKSGNIKILRANRDVLWFDTEP